MSHSQLPTTLHQLLVGATPGDAITDQALLLRQWLREWGMRSDIFATHIHPQLEGEIRPYSQYRPTRQPWVIYHHSIGADLVDDLLARTQQIILIYHNVTPPEFFTQVDPAWAARSARGQAQTAALRSTYHLGIGRFSLQCARVRKVRL
jgi:L-malate glycosyltransferase